MRRQGIDYPHIYIPPCHPHFRKLKKRKSKNPHFQHLGGFLPILKGRKTSKIKPEFVIFDPLRGELGVVKSWRLKTNIQSIKVQIFFDIFCHHCHLFVTSLQSWLIKMLLASFVDPAGTHGLGGLLVKDIKIQRLSGWEYKRIANMLKHQILLSAGSGFWWQGFKPPLIPKASCFVRQSLILRPLNRRDLNLFPFEWGDIQFSRVLISSLGIYIKESESVCPEIFSQLNTFTKRNWQKHKILECLPGKIWKDP